MIQRKPLVVLLALGVIACGRGGGEPGAPVQSPAEQTLRGIPLGAPPGEPLSPAASIQNPHEGDAQAIADGKALFASMNCVYCHGAQGSGLIGPPLDAPGWRYGGTPAELYNSIHDGRPKGMPAWGDRLPSDQIWRIVAYLESLGGASSPASARMVDLGGAHPSTTGPQAADQMQTDTANQTLVDGDQHKVN